MPVRSIAPYCQTILPQCRQSRYFVRRAIVPQSGPSLGGLSLGGSRRTSSDNSCLSSPHRSQTQFLKLWPISLQRVFILLCDGSCSCSQIHQSLASVCEHFLIGRGGILNKPAIAVHGRGKLARLVVGKRLPVVNEGS